MIAMAHDLGSEAAELEQPRLRGKRRRRSLRRALSVECCVECDAWEGSVVFDASDVSDEGLWLDTPYALAPGEELVVSFPLPGDPDAERVWAIAEVARVGMWRRRQDAYPAGMGLVFTYCSQEDLNRLSNALYGRPPRLPNAVPTRGLPPAPAEPQPRLHEVEASLPAVLDWLLASE
jgi:hypothetical protein